MVKKRIDALESKIKVLEAEWREAEIAFIKAKGLNLESLANLHYSDEAFKRLSGELFALPEIAAIDGKIGALCKEQKDCENRLIEMALAIAPAKVADDLRQGLHLVRFRKRIMETYLAYAAG
jgi:hypothetical protein